MFYNPCSMTSPCSELVYPQGKSEMLAPIHQSAPKSEVHPAPAAPGVPLE